MGYNLEAAAAQISELAPRPEHAETAMWHLRQWLESERFLAYRPLLVAMLEAGAWDTLLDSFYRVLPFGTGGRRGPVGVGPNRMNPWALGTSVQGNIHFLRDRFGKDAELSVVIAADVRIFTDLRGVFPGGVANPLLGMTSEDGARTSEPPFSSHEGMLGLYNLLSSHLPSAPSELRAAVGPKLCTFVI